MKGSLPDLWTSIIVVLIVLAASIAAYMVYNFYIGEGACERAVQSQVNKFVSDMRFTSTTGGEREITLLRICVEHVEPAGIKFRSGKETFKFESPDGQPVVFAGISPTPRDEPYKVRIGPPYVITILGDGAPKQ